MGHTVMQQWEYFTAQLYIFSERGKEVIKGGPDLVSLGNQGWELVAAVPLAEQRAAHSGGTHRVI
jgi:hypothetical protein